MLFSAQHSIQARHPGLFHGRPDPEFTIGDGWLMLLEFVLTQMEMATTREERAGICITGIREVKGELVITSSHSSDLVQIDQIIEQARDASKGLCVCCGSYTTATSMWSPLCRLCVH